MCPTKWGMDIHSPTAAAQADTLPATQRGNPAGSKRGDSAGRILPSWAANPLGRELVAQILADPPGYRVGDAAGFKVVEYRGVPAASLRRLFDRESARLLAWADAEYAAGAPWPEASKAWTSLMNGEKPDELIARLIGGRA